MDPRDTRESDDFTDWLRRLCPSLDDRELAEAAGYFDRYLEIVLRIHERVCKDPEALKRLHALTALAAAPTIEQDPPSTAPSPHPHHEESLRLHSRINDQAR